MPTKYVHFTDEQAYLGWSAVIRYCLPIFIAGSFFDLIHSQTVATFTP